MGVSDAGIAAQIQSVFGRAPAKGLDGTTDFNSGNMTLNINPQTNCDSTYGHYSSSTDFQMRWLLVICTAILSAGLVACQKTDDASPRNPFAGLPDASSESDRPRDVRPRPAQSGMSSDPNNPSGLPGPSSGLGTSPNRY